MTATTKVVTAQRDNVVRVPDQALRYLPAGAPAAAPAQPPTATAPAPTAMATAPAPTAPAAAPAQPAPAATRRGQVWVLANGKPVRVAVTLGLDDDTYTEIIGGELKLDDQVILSEQAGGSGKSAVPLPRL